MLSVEAGAPARDDKIKMAGYTHRYKHKTPASRPALRDPLHGEFLALFGAVEKIKVD